VSFLRRLLGGDRPDETTPAATAEELLEDERQHELEMMRSEAERLDDLQQRQLRYADRAWTPPAQGSDRRADDDAGEADEA
jgi:hypothetical protein